MRASPILMLVLLTGCSTPSIKPDPQAAVPVPALLTAELSAPCPSLPLLKDKTIGTLVTEDANSSYDYAKCREINEALKLIYNTTRQVMMDFAKEMGMKTKEISP